MSPSPTSRFSKLSLEGMAPTTRAQSQRQSGGTSTQDPNDSSSDPESDSDSSVIEEDEETGELLVRSPSRLMYRIGDLPPETRETVRAAFKNPPRIALQYCQLSDDNMYAFQMTEVKPLYIRIASAAEGRSSKVDCSCEEKSRPCRHLLWLLDQVLKQTRYENNPKEPLTMKHEGFAEEMGDPFEEISNFHLDVLADSLHCEIISEESEYINPVRVQEVRELLAAISSESPDDYRPDIFSHPRASVGRKVIKRNDLERTIFRMLVSNNEFFCYFMSQMRPTDPINDRFRKLEQRVERVLADLDAYSESKGNEPQSIEGPRNVAWAASHILGVLATIKTEIYNRDSPLSSDERISAARVLVHMLAAVCSRNRDAHAGPTRLDTNLYLRLIGDRDRDFVVGVLHLLPDAATPFVHNLEEIEEQLGVSGAPAPYVAKFRSLLSILRSGKGGSKRQTQGPESSSKRMK